MKKDELIAKNELNMDDIMCPICGEYQMKHFGNVCPICGWEHTPIGLIDPNFLGGANRLTLNDYRKWFEEKRKHDLNYKWEEDPKKYDYFSTKSDENKR